MKQRKRRIIDFQRENSACEKQLEILEQLDYLIKSGEVKNLIVALKLEDVEEQTVGIMADDINLYDFHALVGYLGTELMLRTLNVQQEEEVINRRKMLA